MNKHTEKMKWAMYYSNEYKQRLFVAAQGRRSGKTYAMFDRKPLRSKDIAKILKRKFNGAHVYTNPNPNERVLARQEIKNLQKLANKTKFDPVNAPIIDARKIRDIFENINN